MSVDREMANESDANWEKIRKEKADKKREEETGRKSDEYVPETDGG